MEKNEYLYLLIEQKSFNNIIKTSKKNLNYIPIIKTHTTGNIKQNRGNAQKSIEPTSLESIPSVITNKRSSPSVNSNNQQPTKFLNQVP